MRIKIILVSLLLLILAGWYTTLFLPSVTTMSFYQTYILTYMPFIRKGFSIIMIFGGAYISSLIANLILAQAFRWLLQNNALAKKIFPLTKRVVAVLIGIISLILILGVFGVSIGALVTGAWVGWVFFALAGKEAVSNFSGSLSLIFSHNFKIGDTIRVKGYEGIVEEISLSTTRLVDKTWVVIFIPNKLILSETIENISINPIQKEVKKTVKKKK
ncbi:MAG: hypothetical protein ACD_71C00023G0001 [uncultured bacterium (gcode 4)]|uniref:Mechanosensitive ion channel MscS domain-containing protein n=1 Tax=uncultured bacterium (gcode 4) TaxID=1234023 RepID=K2A3U1_9BACT|nr:MAG: hypothetical protein ACD_71C00023G0001 [uncultured bacterium (gcode 4)]